MYVKFFVSHDHIVYRIGMSLQYKRQTVTRAKTKLILKLTFLSLAVFNLNTVTFPCSRMALNGPYCADVPLSNYSLLV